MRYCHLCLLIAALLLSSPSAKAGFSDDSTAVAQLFQKAIIQKDSSAAILLQISEISKKYPSDNAFKDIYHFHEARYYLQSGCFEEAIQKINTGKNFAEAYLPEIKTAKYYNLLGSVDVLQKKFQSGIQHYQKAIQMLEKANDTLQIAYIQNNIANTFFNLRDFQAAYKYISAAVRVVQNVKDTQNLSGMLGVLSIAETKLNKLKEAQLHAEQALEMSKRKSNVLGIIVAHYSLGEVALQSGDYAKAEAAFLQSLAMAEQFKQLNYVVLAKIGLTSATLKLQKYTDCIRYGEEAMQISLQTGNLNPVAVLQRNLSEAYAANGNYAKAYENIRQAYLSKDSTITAENQQIINDLLIKYDTQKKENLIAESQLEIERQKLIVRQSIAAIAILLLLLAFAILLYNSRKKIHAQKLQTLQQENEKAVLQAILKGEEEERKRLSAELHDGIAADITALKMNMEFHHPEIPYIDTLGKIHKDVRRVSHNLRPLQLKEQGILQAFRAFCKENSLPHCRIEYIEQSKEAALLTEAQQLGLFRCMQELVQNALKHAQASHIYVQLISVQNGLQLSVDDNGSGMPASQTAALEQTLHERYRWMNASIFAESNTLGTSVGLIIKRNESA